MRGRCPYHLGVLIFDNMLALNHVRYFQIIKLYFRILMVSRLEEHLNMIKKTEWLLPVNWQQRFYVEIAAAS